MNDGASFIGFVTALVIMLTILELLRRQRLREEYSLLWLASAFVVLTICCVRPVRDMLAQVMAMTHSASVLLVIVISSMLFLLLQAATALSRLSRENKEIAQQLALLRWQVEQGGKSKLHTA